MFKSVADIAAERLATAHNTTSAAQDDASPGQQRYSEREDAQRRNRNQDAFSVQMDKPGSLYEAERARERELEREGGHQSPLDRVRELELHVARTKGNSLAGNSVSALRSSSANGKPSTTYPSSFENSLPDWGQDVPKSPSKSPPRKYGDIKMPLHAAVSPSAASTESERRESGQNDLSLPDENISLAIYFDEEMRLLCQLPAAARAMRRDLVADLAKVLRVSSQRFSLVDLYEGPVAEVIVKKLDKPGQVEDSGSSTGLRLADKLSQMITSGSTSPAIQQSQYFRNISSVKNCGNAAAARPLSAILRPLVDTIEEGLEKMNRMGVQERERQTPSRDFETSVKSSEAQNLLNLSSDSDADSLTYTASVFTIQSSRVVDDQQSNPDTARSRDTARLRGAADTARSRGAADSSATVSSDDEDTEVLQNHMADRHTDFSREGGPMSGRIVEAPDLSPESPPTAAALSEWSPLAVNFSLEVVRAKGLPQAENAGIFPYTYACVSLLYADLWSMEQLPVDHATGGEHHENNGEFVCVQDVQSLPFKIIPQVRTQTHARSVNPNWQKKFTLTDTRPSFMVLDGPNYTKRLFSSQRDVPLQGQNVLLMVTVHEEHRFGAHSRMGGMVLELKPGPPVNDWFTLHTRDGTPVPSSIGPGFAAVQLRIAYPGSMSDSISPYRSMSSAHVSTMFTPYRIPDSVHSHDLELSYPDVSFVSPPQRKRDPLVDADEFLDVVEAKVDKPRKEDIVDDTYLEKVARHIFNVNHSGKKSPKPSIHTTQTTHPSSPDNRNRPNHSISNGQDRLSDSGKEGNKGRGLHVEILSSRNLPQRLAQGHDPLPYACVSLILVHRSEADMITSGQRQLSHDVRRAGSKKSTSVNQKMLRIVPQCQTKALPPTRSPEWGEYLFLDKGTCVDQNHNASIEQLRTLVSTKNDAYLVLLSVCDSFEFGSDRLLGSCIFPILPGQRMEQTLRLRGCDRLEENAGSDQMPEIRVSVFLNLPPPPRHSSPSPQKRMSPVRRLSPVSTTPLHRETSPCLTPLRMGGGMMASPPSSAALISHRSYLDLSDSESEDEGLQIRTPAADSMLSVLSSASSTHSSTVSRAHRGDSKPVEGNATSPAHIATDLTYPSSRPVPSIQPSMWGKLPHGGQHAAMSRTTTSPPRRHGFPQEMTRSIPGSPVEQSKPVSPSYTELEKAFMARVAARQSQLSQPEDTRNRKEPASFQNLPLTETSLEYERRLKGMSLAAKGGALREVHELDLSDQTAGGGGGGQFGTSPPPPPEKRKASHGVGAYGSSGGYRPQWKPTGVER